MTSRVLKSKNKIQKLKCVRKPPEYTAILTILEHFYTQSIPFLLFKIYFDILILYFFHVISYFEVILSKYFNFFSHTSFIPRRHHPSHKHCTKITNYAIFSSYLLICLRLKYLILRFDLEHLQNMV